MHLFVLPEPLAVALREYLVKRPYEEVHELVLALDNLSTAHLTPLAEASEQSDVVEAEATQTEPTGKDPKEGK